MTYKDIARIKNVQTDRKVLITTFKIDSYGRHVAIAKSLFTKAQNRVRLTYATNHLSWKSEYWAYVIWTARLWKITCEPVTRKEV
jgi:hypothetical protein